MNCFELSIASQPLYAPVLEAYRADEAEHVARLLHEARLSPEARHPIGERARTLVTAVRQRGVHGGLDGLMQEYNLSNQEGVVLMCLAEALLRIPDA
jgi:RHH-type proline utilization regulon transcriptional repressor/proline dehydrogenase/delta 1-pyrroline-5-carboxylate dehydrogenase